MRKESLIGIDIGTTSVKAVMIGLDGQRLAEFSEHYPTHRPGPGRVEQDPQDWLRRVQAALAGFAGRGLVRAIGLTSQVNTHVFADAAFSPLCPAITWQDQRAAEAGAAIDAGIDPASKLRWLGAPIPVDASHALARMAWMAAAEPALWSRTAHVMAPKDWVLAQLTGAVRADPLASVGLVGTDLAYAGGLIARVPGAAARLAPLADPLSPGGVMRDGPFAGVPVVLGTMDAWASLLGLGVTDAGQAMYLSGTSEVLGIVSPQRNAEPGIITFPDWAGITLHAAPTQAGGASLDWVARLLGQAVGPLLAGAAPVTADTPLFLPHLQGERAPLWDAQARGAFAGLTGAHAGPDLVAAVLEGVAFSARLALEALERSAGVVPELLRHGGGGAASDLWCQIRADALGKPLLRMQGRDPGAVGAAVMAGAGCGAMADLTQAARELVRPDRRFAPDPARAALTDRRFALWRQTYDGLRPVNAGLAL